MTSPDQVHVVAGPDLTAADVYAIWQIRDLVFQCEQAITEPDVDGVDLRADCSHVWLADDAGITSYLRTYLDDGHRKIGRVCTRRDSRGLGQSGRLIEAVHAQWPGEEIHLGAQAHLEAWYGKHGYVRTGPHYDDAGIDHVPMTREPQTS